MAKDVRTLSKKEAELPQGVERVSPRRVFMPRTDVYETQDNVMIAADMPGVDEKSVEITLEKNVLTIRGAVASMEIPGHTLAYAEYEVGDYERAFTLSEEINRDAVQALVRNGVLYLTLPKAAAAKARKIEVKAA